MRTSCNHDAGVAVFIVSSGIAVALHWPACSSLLPLSSDPISESAANSNVCASAPQLRGAKLGPLPEESAPAAGAGGRQKVCRLPAPAAWAQLRLLSLLKGHSARFSKG